MKNEHFTFTDTENIPIFVYKWTPEDISKAVGIVQIMHGMAEHAGRGGYERFANVLSANGFIVYANDHRGHGKTAGTVEKTGFIGEKNGFDMMVKDEYMISDRAGKEHPGLPLFVFAHSMGSFIAQLYAEESGSRLKGLVLSGTNGPGGSLVAAGRIIAGLLSVLQGKRHRSPLLDSMSFGSFNSHFKPNRTAFDWLSRDNAEVDKYVADPFCGFICATSTFYFLTDALLRMHKPAAMKRIPKTLPILMVSGANDPVGVNGAGVKLLADIYRTNGVADLTVKLYPDARHEILNETNRDEVMADVVAWLQARLK